MSKAPVIYRRKRTNKRQRLPILFWCSLAYLIVELAFSAQLLELAGSSIDAARLNSIEYVCRTLSGIAVSLFLISYIAKRYRPGLPRFCSALTITLVTIAGVWLIQEMLINGLVARIVTERDQLDKAVILTTATDLIREGHIKIPSLDLSTEVLASPDGLSFMAMFPALSINHPTIVSDLKPLLPNAIKRSLILSCDVALPCLGTPEQFLEEHWPDLRTSLDPIYQQYDKARQSVIDPPADLLRRHARAAWSDYNRGLAIRRLDHTTRHKARVRQQVRQKGILVPDNWSLDDYEGFERAVRGKIMRDAKPAFTRFSRELLGHPDLPPDLDESGFFQRADIQALIWQQRGLNEVETKQLQSRLPVLNPTLSDAAVKASLYPDMLSFRVTYTILNLTGADTLKTRRDWLVIGESAAESLIVPPIALAFSIVGALSHIAKVMGYLLGLIMPRGRAIAVAATVGLGLTGYLFLSPTGITETAPYQVFEGYTRDVLGGWAGYSLRLIIHAEAKLYPVNDFIHEQVLQDFDFSQF